ncbi:MAG: AMP-binding protein [Bacteroidota bacterium]
MNEPKRLFDCIEYHLQQQPLDVMLAGKESGQWKTYSTKEVAAIVNDLSAGLINMGIGPNDMTVEGRDKIAILCKNRPEWLMVDMAVQQIGALLVPIYPTINVNELDLY